MNHSQYSLNWTLASLYCIVSWSLKTVYVWRDCLNAKQWRHTHTHRIATHTHTVGHFSLGQKAQRQNRVKWEAQRASHSPLLLRLKATYHKPRGRMQSRIKTVCFPVIGASERSTEPVINSQRMWWRNRSWELQRRARAFPRVQTHYGSGPSVS